MRDNIIIDFLDYLISEIECSDCRFSDTCDELEDKGQGCLCDKAYHSLYSKDQLNKSIILSE